MAAEEFNPVDQARPPREEGWEEETEEIIDAINNRGDQRIGQLVINAISQEFEYEDPPEPGKDVDELTDEEREQLIEDLEKHRNEQKARLEQKIWSIEADELARLLNKLQSDQE